MWAERGQSTHQIDSPAPRLTSSALMKCNRASLEGAPKCSSENTSSRLAAAPTKTSTCVPKETAPPRIA